ncbi:MAG: MinD/ParA family protein [Halanaerobiaceae bacterium]|jgi:flagellar biosynthesis protein FlhG|nr:MinD/ParA family protein [Halanaerobiaceae bacterium]
MNDQAARLRERVLNNKQKTRIIAVASGKGGVGKSSISLNLALAIQELDKKVLLLDTDLGMANIDILLGITPNFNLSHVLKGKCRLEEAVVRGPADISFLAGTTGVDELINISSVEAGRLIEAASQMEENYDIILLDIGAGVHYSVTNFIMGSDEVLVILTPEPTAVMDAYSLIKILSIKHYNGKIKLLLNQCNSLKEGNELTGRMQRVIKQYLNKDVELLGMIPYDEKVRISVKKQNPLLIQYPKSEAARSIKEIAVKIMNSACKSQSHGTKGFVYRIIGAFNRRQIS